MHNFLSVRFKVGLALVCLLVLSLALIACGDSPTPGPVSTTANSNLTSAASTTTASPTTIGVTANTTTAVTTVSNPTSVAITTGIATNSASTTSASPTIATSATAVDPQAYLDKALDIIQQNAFYANKLDWPVERKQAHETAKDAKTTADTYPVITGVLSKLGDRHSQFWPPQTATQTLQTGRTQGFGFVLMPPDWVIVQVYPDSSAAKVGIKRGDVIVGLKGTPVSSKTSSQELAQLFKGDTLQLQLKRAGQTEPINVTVESGEFSSYLPPQSRRLNDNIGYVEVPGFVPNPQSTADQFATNIQQQIQAVDQTPTCGWVVDLRLNTGGGFHGMVGGIGPILGEGEVGSFYSPTARQKWIYQGGQFRVDDFVGAKVVPPYQLKKPNPAVAVLTGSATASSGEATLIAFRGRPNTRTFGAPTAGVPTGNSTYPMADGAVLVITVVLDSDRTGQNYDHSILPDQAESFDWEDFTTDRDQVLQAATTWLKSQPSCTNG